MYIKLYRKQASRASFLYKYNQPTIRLQTWTSCEDSCDRAASSSSTGNKQSELWAPSLTYGSYEQLVNDLTQDEFNDRLLI